MPSRLRLVDLRLSNLPGDLGLCVGDVPRIAQVANTAQRRLLYCKEAGDEGWFGSWAEVKLPVSRCAPYITLPREIARIEAVNVCDQPILLNNQFAEYLQFGNGRMPKLCRSRLGSNRVTEAYTRNDAVLFQDLINPPQIIAIYATNAADMQGLSRVLIQGTDQNNVTVYTQDTLVRVQGIFLTLKSPFVSTPFPFMQITGVQKDVTLGQIQIFQVDPNTGAQVLLLTMEPGETTAGYRRYFFHNLPCTCRPSAINPCLTTPGECQNIHVTALAKLELVPVVTDTDYLLFHNLEAITEEAQSARYDTMDNGAGKAMADYHHKAAVRNLNGELIHYIGAKDAAIDFKPFGSARLERVKIGMI